VVGSCSHREKGHLVASTLVWSHDPPVLLAASLLG